MEKEDILFQLDISWQLFQYHVSNLTDEEALWCKTEQGLQIRQMDGTWAADWPETEAYTIGPASIAWTMWHILYWWKTTMDYSFGNGTLKKEDVLWPGSVELAVKEISRLHEEWIKILSEMPKADFESPKYAKWPFADTSFCRIALWLNAEFMKNVAEIGHGRYLYVVSMETDIEQ